jgi:hypothetical protein
MTPTTVSMFSQSGAIGQDISHLLHSRASASRAQGRTALMVRRRSSPGARLTSFLSTFSTPQHGGRRASSKVARGLTGWTSALSRTAGLAHRHMSPSRDFLALTPRVHGRRDGVSPRLETTIPTLQSASPSCRP